MRRTPALSPEQAEALSEVRRIRDKLVRQQRALQGTRGELLRAMHSATQLGVAKARVADAAAYHPSRLSQLGV